MYSSQQRSWSDSSINSSISHYMNHCCNRCAYPYDTASASPFQRLSDEDISHRFHIHMYACRTFFSAQLAYSKFQPDVDELQHNVTVNVGQSGIIEDTQHYSSRTPWVRLYLRLEQERRISVLKTIYCIVESTCTASCINH